MHMRDRLPIICSLDSSVKNDQTLWLSIYINDLREFVYDANSTAHCCSENCYFDAETKAAWCCFDDLYCKTWRILLSCERKTTFETISFEN